MKKDSELISIYFGTEKETFCTLKQEVKDIWYEHYGESLTVGKTILTALTLLRDSLNGRENAFDKRKLKIKDKYWRM